MIADRWPDDVRLSDIEPLFTRQVCGQRRRPTSGPDFSWETRRATIHKSSDSKLHPALYLRFKRLLHGVVFVMHVRFHIHQKIGDPQKAGK